MKLFEPLSLQHHAMEPERTYWLVCSGPRANPLILEVGKNPPDAYDKARWWRRCGLEVYVLPYARPASLTDKMRACQSFEDLRRLHDLENRRYFSGFSGCEVE